jgi:hypothetical protein
MNIWRSEGGRGEHGGAAAEKEQGQSMVMIIKTQAHTYTHT